VLVIGYAVTMPEYIEGGGRLYAARNFFGIKKVINEDRYTRKLLHGDTMHGLESLDPLESGQPISYYHPTGPVGDVMQVLAGRPNQHLGVVGLGAGTVAAYAAPNRRVTFFDVDPQVKSIAQNFFTYLGRCGSNCEVVIADGRLAIGQTSDSSFDLLMLDAFSSDAIPAHLISREAVAMYRSKLKPDGLLLFHVSNRYLDVATLAATVLTDSGLVALMRSDRDVRIPGKAGSDYIVAAARLENVGMIATNQAWQPVSPRPGIVAWTDDYSSVLSLVRWRGR
jgi:SAM-dependent methyltransferase